MDEALIIRFGCELLEEPKIGDEIYELVRTYYGGNGLNGLIATS